MEKKNYAVLDVAKFISALLVIAIHCAPFMQVNETMNFVFVQILARLAVPFFFITSGFLLFRKIDPSKGRTDKQNVQALKRYWLRILKVYILWSILYLPLLILGWVQGGFDASTIFRFVRDLFVGGTYYHLWFLPSLLIGIPLVYWLYTSISKRMMLWLSGLLYLIGMAVNVYGVVLLDVSGINAIITAYESVFVTTRNGFFFAPIFLVLGIYAKDFLLESYKKPALFATFVSFVLFVAEAFWLQNIGIMQDVTSMYLMVVPCVFFLFIYLVQCNLKPSGLYKNLRKMSLLIYVSHIYFIFIFLNVLKFSNILVYLISIGCSCVFAYMVLLLSKKITWLKAFY